MRQPSAGSGYCGSAERIRGAAWTMTRITVSITAYSTTSLLVASILRVWPTSRVAGLAGRFHSPRGQNRTGRRPRPRFHAGHTLASRTLQLLPGEVLFDQKSATTHRVRSQCSATLSLYGSRGASTVVIKLLILNTASSIRLVHPDRIGREQLFPVTCR